LRLRGFYFNRTSLSDLGRKRERPDSSTKIRERKIPLSPSDFIQSRTIRDSLKFLRRQRAD
jgi:hypothetical protein